MGDDEMPRMTQIPLATRFGRLVTTSLTFAKTRPDGKSRESWVRVHCDCGTDLEVRSHLLGYQKDGETRYQRSCGCLTIERLREVNSRRGPESASWRGGRSTDGQGYVKIWVGRGNHPKARVTDYVAEHILVMERVLGRHLYDNENVHHKNGMRDDNRPENLELWVTHQPKGQRPEDLLEWAREIIDRYADAADHPGAGQ